jgi:hypothetical protein
MFFWILWGFDALIALVFLYFFFVGIGDGSVSSFNMGMWLLILSGLAAVLVSGFLLNRYQHQTAAKLVLSLVAFPGLMYGLFVLMLMGVKDWK